MSKLSLLNWNVEGLIQKLELTDFINFVTTFDIICFTETFVTFPFSSSVFRDYTIFTATAKKLSHFGRASGGVISLVHKRFADSVQLLTTDFDNTIAFKVEKHVFSTDKDIVFIHTYIPPCESSYYNTSEHGYGLEQLDECVSRLLETMDEVYLLICGDFNSRTKC